MSLQFVYVGSLQTKKMCLTVLTCTYVLTSWLALADLLLSHTKHSILKRTYVRTYIQQKGEEEIFKECKTQLASAFPFKKCVVVVYALLYA